ncbi:Cytochrome b6-f complex iron-sulfur subunit [Anatilimnocola aggregata]|uniref:Cytochrome b6-f complex iron-sulfur subunit n=1 Tax=Anatilimnocola aggregata TaxID=2528021 RepID=A0A517YDB4_9BACT|nr:Rieske 2Fe-2S domain-containing protein [Anatilimnocola aggregata]QDU28228.1 Cytochrome b6-f complex iron-sulfur subunit [Anatilimnocola aggregata]
MQTEPTPPLDLLPGRRTFFGWFTYALGAIAAFVLGLPLAQYFLGTNKSQLAWVKLGDVDSFPTGETRMVTFDNPIRQPWDGKTSHTGVFVRYRGKDTKQQDQFLILAVNCAHLGCPVSWFPQSGLFMCPCHGGVYHANGERASGPPPRGLFRCVWRVEKGQLEVQAPHFPSLQDTLDPQGDPALLAGNLPRCDHA